MDSEGACSWPPHQCWAKFLQEVALNKYLQNMVHGSHLSIYIQQCPMQCILRRDKVRWHRTLIWVIFYVSTFWYCLNWDVTELLFRMWFIHEKLSAACYGSLCSNYNMTESTLPLSLSSSITLLSNKQINKILKVKLQAQVMPIR